MSSKTLLFSGTTLQRAVLAAASQLGIEAEELDYRLRERSGAVRNATKVIIEVDPDSPRKVAGSRAAPTPAPPSPARPLVAPQREPAPEPAHAPRPSPPAPVRSDRPAGPRVIANGPEAEAVSEAVGRLLALGGLRVEARPYAGEGAIEIELEGPDQTLLVGGEGELLSALGHLVPRVARGLVGESVTVRLDSAGFREDHESRLRGLALERAEQVRRSGRPVVLEEMNPADRRIVHLALADEEGVETESRGEGFFKRVSILPRKRRSS